MENILSEKPKVNRAELLAKARAVKAAKAAERAAVKQPKEESKIEDKEVEELLKEPEVKKIKEPEVVNETVRIPGNKKKKIVKRIIELEESETEEEVIEEIVRIPKMKKEVKISRDEMKKKLKEQNNQKLYNELFN